MIRSPAVAYSLKKKHQASPGITPKNGNDTISLMCKKKKKSTVNGASFAMIYIKKSVLKTKWGRKEIYLPLIGGSKRTRKFTVELKK